MLNGEISIVPALKCGDCTHWHRLPAPRGVVDLSTPPQGECRAVPPVVVPIGNGGMAAVYPQLPTETRTCGMYKGRVVS